MSVTEVTVADPAGTGVTAGPDARLDVWSWCAAVYLLVPVAVFAVGWLAPLPALVVLGGVVAAALALGRPGPPPARWWRTLVLAVAVAVVWTWASGIVSHSTAPTFDWAKHTALLGDLVRSPWPARVATPDNEYYVRYYVAWYLLPALAGKAAGIGTTLWFSAVWTGVGFALVAAWVVDRFTRPWARVGAAAGFVLFGGLDLLGGLVTQVVNGRAAFGDFTHLEVWSGMYQYSSHTVQALWVPQHALGGWMATLLVIEGHRRRRPLVLVLAVFAAVLWSPFAALGLAPIAAVGLVRLHRAGAVPWRSPRAVASAGAMGLGALVLALYLSSAPSGIPLHAAWSIDQRPAFPVSYLLFVLFDAFVLFGVAAWVRGRIEWIEWTAGAVLAALPFIVYGLFNDLSRRASIPALFVVCLMVLTAAFGDDLDPRRRFVRPSRVVLWLLMAVAAVTPVTEVVTRVRFSDGFRTPIECSIVDTWCSGIDGDSQPQYLAPTMGNRLHRILR